MKYRTERDPLGDVQVPGDAWYGAQTRRAVENFPISGLTAPPELVTATVLIKKAAAETNAALGRLDKTIAGAIASAADEILSGAHRDQFVVDVYQAGAGTSHNMNTNEVLANLAEERLGGRRGTYARVHPNDHVNMGQSTNDVFPTATRLSLLALVPALLNAATALADSLEAKAGEFAGILKTGRTHLQDAVPITLGQEFSGYAANVRSGIADVEHAATGLYELNLGATAVGTGLNAGDDYTSLAVGETGRGHGPSAAPGGEPLSRHAEYGGRARVLGRVETTRGRGRQGRVGSPSAQHGATRRDRRDPAPGRAARFFDHARQGESIGP